MGLIKPTEILPEQSVIVYLYGDPGCYKTSLAQTCNNPLTLDFNRAIKRAVGRKEAFVFEKGEGWKELMEAVKNGLLDNFKTIVWDTAKDALDDFLVNYVISLDYKLKTNTLKMYGKIAEEFKLFLGLCRDKCIDILIIAHAKSEQEGDIIKKIADVTGQTNALLYRVCDQMGYVTTRNGAVVIDFQRNDSFLTKNVAKLTQLVLPHFLTPEWEGYCEREIISVVRAELSSMSEEQKSALQFIESWREKIDQIVPLEEADKTDELLKGISKAVAEITPEHMKKQVQAYLVGHLAKIGWKWNGAEKVFKSVKIIEANTSPVSDDKPASEEIDLVKDAEAQRAALAPKEDLFASTK